MATAASSRGSGFRFTGSIPFTYLPDFACPRFILRVSTSTLPLLRQLVPVVGSPDATPPGASSSGGLHIIMRIQTFGMIIGERFIQTKVSPRGHRQQS
jgi:hypothetical protein